MYINPNEVPARRLLIVAGPSRVGKSILMKRIKSGELTAQFESLGLDGIQDWERHHANILIRNPACRPTRLIMHFDLYAQLHMRARNEWLSGLLAQYDEVYGLTLCTHHKKLKRRVPGGLRVLLKKQWRFLRYSKVSKKSHSHKEKRFFYSNPSNIKGLYQQFHDFLADHPNVRAQWMMDTSQLGNSTILPMEKTRLLALLADGASLESGTDP